MRRECMCGGVRRGVRSFRLEGVGVIVMLALESGAVGPCL